MTNDTSPNAYDVNESGTFSGNFLNVSEMYIDDYVKVDRRISQWAYWLYKKLCGAVIHMTYSKLFNEWSLCVFYWRSSLSSCGNCGLYPPPMMSLERNPHIYFSGFCSRERGRHLNIKLRGQRY